MTSETPRQRLRYDRGEHRVKHCWKEPESAFVRDGSAETGKCLSTLSKQLAEQLLNDGIGYPVGHELVPLEAAVNDAHPRACVRATPPKRPARADRRPWLYGKSV